MRQSENIYHDSIEGINKASSLQEVIHHIFRQQGQIIDRQLSRQKAMYQVTNSKSALAPYRKLSHNPFHLNLDSILT
jgi:hypothetical protein